MNYSELLRRTAAGEVPDVAAIARLLQAPDEAAEAALFAAAYAVKLEYCSNLVNLRGLIEFSNICTRDCLYCGIRKSNRKVTRYQMSIDEIVAAARCAGEFGYGSVVLQSGERSDPEFADQVTEILRQIAALPYDLGVTLSCGEQSLETYCRWREAGAFKSGNFCSNPPRRMQLCRPGGGVGKIENCRISGRYRSYDRSAGPDVGTSGGGY